MRSKRTLLVIALSLFAPIAAKATLTVTPITWNIVGLDSNNPAAGPHLFPVGARVCSNVATTNVAVNFVFDTGNANINLRAGSLSSINLPAIGAGQCADAYFEVDVLQVPAAFDTTRRYHITATDGSGTFSTVTPREIYVEHLISQSRNSVGDVKVGPVGGPYTSVAPGGSMSLVVGNTYDIQLFGGTATQGYNQFEEFINFPNTIFQVQAVNTTYSADDSPFVPNPDNKLYADACLWQNDPNSPEYRACVGGDFKAGGNSVVTTYTIKIISGGGTSQTLGSLLYDFSGSSYHYNSDFGFGARIANIVDPTSANISKSFSPSTTSINGISALTITLTNPNPGTLGGYNFVDNLPANLVVATPNGATTSGCGAQTLTATAGSGSISFSNGTLAANSTCVVKVNVTPTATGSLVNTTNHLFINSVDTTHSATATLTVNNAPPPGTGLCGITLANWSVPNGTTANPPDLVGGLPTAKAPNVATATLAANVAGDTSINTTSGHVDTTSWTTFGYKNDGQFIQFTLDTTNFTGVQMSFWVANPSPANGPTQITVTVNNGGGFGAPVLTINSPAAAFTNHTIDLTGLTNTGGNTLIRITATGANNDASGASLLYDDMVFTGCTSAVKPTIAKAFSPNPIAVNGVSTLTFTLTNTNPVPLTGAAFNDTLPAGVQVAAAPAAATTCGGAWSPAAGNTTLTFAAGTIPASGSCTVSVNVTATTAGPHGNVSGFLSTTEGGTNTNSIASASLTAVLPPSIAKQFAPTPILPNGTSTLTFTITNPNQNDALGGVAFGDTFPTSPGAMVVAAVPNATTTGCGSPTFAPVAGAGSISFSGGTIAGGGTCTVTVSVTAPAAGTYNNTSGPVSHVINAQTVNGNTAAASLVVNPPNPSIHLLKQVNSTGSGLFFPFLATPIGGNVDYRFTVENTGDVALTSPQLTDNAVDVSTCNATWSGLTLQPGDIVTCVVGPISAVSGVHTNTASVSATFNASPVTSPNSSATYATTALSLAKSVTETSFTLPGEVLHYSYLVTNSGFAPLAGPVTVSDNRATVTCPAVSTVGDLDNFLDPGESVTCTATYTITPTDVANAQVTNTAQATADGVNSNQDTKMVPLSTSADVSIDKTLNTAAPYLTGQSVSYTLTVANGGPSTATNIQVTDTPTNLSITSVSGSGCAALPCTIASLASGANTQISVTATITAAGAFDNSATATAAQPDPNPSNNTDNTNNGGTAVDSADLAVVKTFVTQGPYRMGDVIAFNIAVTNNGPSTATNVVVVDHPVGLTIQSMGSANCTGAVINGNPNQNVQCTIASLANGATENVSVTAHIDNPGQFLNRGIVSADQNDPNTNDNQSDAVDVATTSADVSIVKAITTAGPYYVGETITYTLTVHNAGPSPASFVVVNDTPTNMTIQSVSGANCSSFPCTMSGPPIMVIGNTRVITVTATINAAGAFSNTATANGNDFDPDSSNNSSTAGDVTSPSADLAVLKTFVTPGPYRQGDVITFNIAVTNNGPDTATNVVVLDHPVGLTIQSMSGGGCTGAVINGNPNQNVQCTIASLANGATANVTVTAHIDNPGQYLNRATVTEDQIDPNTNNNLSDAVDVATTSADVSIVKALVTAGPYYVGETITYTLTVHNAGPSPASFVVVSDTPTNLTIQSVSGANCSSLPCTMSGPPIMVIGNTRVITVTATINAVGAFDNSASANGNDFDPNTANNTDNTGNGGVAVAAADVSIVKTLTTAGPFVQGQSLTYTLVVANAGPSTATNIQVTDTPTDLTITNVSGSGCAALPCTIASLASGANTTITVTATITASGTFDNVATATGTEIDPIPSNNTDSTGNGGTTGAPSADVSMVKTLTTAGPFTPGQTIAYTLVVANAGPSTATNIQVTDTPTNLTITNVSGGGCAALPCSIAILGNGASVTINVTATITAAGAFDNSATATPAESDPNPSNNTDSTNNGGTAASTSVDLAITKTPSATTVATGGTLDYTIVVHNNGPATATGVTVSDALPAGYTLITATPTQGSCSGTTTVTCSLGTLVNGATATITLHGTATGQGSLSNTASVASVETDSATSNNTSTVAVMVVADVPTLGEWALMLMGLMLAFAGMMVLRR
jgi:large repetitive protein